MEGVETGVACN